MAPWETPHISIARMSCPIDIETPIDAISNIANGATKTLRNTYKPKWYWLWLHCARERSERPFFLQTRNTKTYFLIHDFAGPGSLRKVEICLRLFISTH